MTLSTALQSIYNQQTDKTQNDMGNSDIGQDPSVPDQDIEMVGAEDAAGDMDDQFDTESEPSVPDNATNTLAKSLIAWIVDNSESIHAYLDQVEGDGSDEMDYEDSEFGDFGHDDGDMDAMSDTSDVDGMGDPSAMSNPDGDESNKFKEFEEKDQPTSQSFPGADTEQSPELGDNSFSDSPDGGMDSMDSMEDDIEDPDKQGDIRTVPNAHLVYKRQVADGTFEELWFYNSDKDASRSDEDIKKDILSGTDIDATKLSSEDGTQQYTIWTIGNGQMIQIIGLAN